MPTTNLHEKSFSPDQRTEEAKLEEYNQQFTQTVDGHFEKVRNVTDKVEAVFSFMAALRVLGHAISALAHMLPPIRLALEALNTGWDILKNILINKSSKLSTGAKILYVLGILGFAIAVILFPAVAAILYAASAGLTLIKDVTKTVHAYKEYRHINHELKKAEKELKQLGLASDPATKSKLQQHIAQLTTEKTRTKTELRENMLNVALSTLVVVGVILMVFPPTFIIGASLLVGTAVIGIAAKVAPKIGSWVKAKWQASKNKSAANVAPSENKDAPKNKPGLLNWLKNKFNNTDKKTFIQKTNSAPANEESTANTHNAALTVEHDSTYKLAELLNEQPNDKEHMRQELIHAATPDSLETKESSPTEKIAETIPVKASTNIKNKPGAEATDSESEGGDENEDGESESGDAKEEENERINRRLD